MANFNDTRDALLQAIKTIAGEADQLAQGFDEHRDSGPGSPRLMALKSLAESAQALAEAAALIRGG